MDKGFVYTEKQVKFLLGSFTGALIAEGFLNEEDTLKTLPVFKKFWEDYKDINNLPNQELVKILTS